MNINELNELNKKDEQELQLSNMFNNNTLIKHTYSELRHNIEHFNNVIQAIDYTIDDLYLMYTENVKTRYILISTCTFYLLKSENNTIYMKLKEFFSSPPNNISRNAEDYFLNSLEEISFNISIASLDNYNYNYLIKLISELIQLIPRKLSISFNKLNYKIFNTIEDDLFYY